VREAEYQALQNAHKVLLARTERDLQSKINGQAAEIDCLKSRIKDLESDIENLRDGKDAVEDAFLTFLTSLKE
jgi:cell division protein FtsB